MRVHASEAGAVAVVACYHVGYSTRRTLIDLARMRGEDDAIPAIERLHDFDGTAADLERAAELFRSAGREADAAALLQLLEEGEGRCSG